MKVLTEAGGAPLGRPLEPEEHKRLFEAAASNPEWEHVYGAAVLAANTSMRAVEVKHARRRDVDLPRERDQTRLKAQEKSIFRSTRTETSL